MGRTGRLPLTLRRRRTRQDDYDEEIWAHGYVLARFREYGPDGRLQHRRREIPWPPDADTMAEKAKDELGILSFRQRMLSCRHRATGTVVVAVGDEGSIELEGLTSNGSGTTPAGENPQQPQLSRRQRACARVRAGEGE